MEKFRKGKTPLLSQKNHPKLGYSLKERDVARRNSKRYKHATIENKWVEVAIFGKKDPERAIFSDIATKIWMDQESGCSRIWEISGFNGKLRKITINYGKRPEVTRFEKRAIFWNP